MDLWKTNHAIAPPSIHEYQIDIVINAVIHVAGPYERAYAKLCLHMKLPAALLLALNRIFAHGFGTFAA